MEGADAVATCAGDVVELVHGSGGTVVVLESVQQMRAAGCTVLVVRPLGPDDAALLLRRTAGSVGVDLGDDPATVAGIAQVCAAVDGTPLPVELAATRLPSVPLTELAALLSSPVRALSALSAPSVPGADGGGLRGTLLAHRDRTSAPAQLLLDMLAAFVGPFSVEAVEAVCGNLVASPLDALDELVDLRLVELVLGEGDGRYRLSRLVHGFAEERLHASGLAPSVRARHAAHYAGLARQAARAVDDVHEGAASALLAPGWWETIDALGWLSDHQPAAALRLAADLGWDAHNRGAVTWLAASLEQLCSRVPAEEAVAARRDALLWLVQFQSWSPGSGDRSELIARRLREGLELARGLGEPLPLLRALHVRFLAIAALGDVPAAMAACREGVERAGSLGHARWMGRFEIALASLHSLLLEHAAASELAASGPARALRSGDRRAVVLASLVLHGLPPRTTTQVRGMPSLEAVLAITTEIGDREDATHVLAVLAHRAVDLGDASDAARWVLARQEHLGRAALLHGLTVSVMLGVHVAVLRGELATAARLHGAVAAHVELLLPLLNPVHVRQYQGALEAARTGLELSRYDAEVSAGRVLDREETLLALMEHLHATLQKMPRQRTPEPTAPARAGLSPREQEVLGLLARGLRNKEVALELHVTPKTVMHHTAAIYRKLGVRGRTEAVTAGWRLGLVAGD